MTVTTWLIVALIFGTLALAAAFMIPAYLRQKIPWKQLPGSTARYHIVEGAWVNETMLREAYNAAVLSLRHTDFTPLTRAKMASTISIIVQKTVDWDSPAHGGKIAGMADGLILYVGSDLAALAHEMAHACEFLEGYIDHNHSVWKLRGIHAAVDAYQQYLRGMNEAIGDVRSTA